MNWWFRSITFSIITIVVWSFREPNSFLSVCIEKLIFSFYFKIIDFSIFAFPMCGNCQFNLRCLFSFLAAFFLSIGHSGLCGHQNEEPAFAVWLVLLRVLPCSTWLYSQFGVHKLYIKVGGLRAYIDPMAIVHSFRIRMYQWHFAKARLREEKGHHGGVQVTGSLVNQCVKFI